VWPFLDVQPATYRLRVLNGSNARTFRLVLLRDGHPELERITQIGTDSGLLPTPVAVPADGLALASAERADLLVDCSDLEPGSQLTLVNTAGAPFDGLATDLTAPTRADLSGAVRRTVALVEQEFEDTPNMLTMRELADASDNPDEPVITIVDQDGTTVARLRTVATHFEDATTFFPMLGGWEVWQLINLSGDTHPIHLHLDPFTSWDAARSPSPSPRTASATTRRPPPCAWPLTPTTRSTTPSTPTKMGSRTPSGSTPTRSSSSPSASAPTAAATCTTATSSNTRTAT
jgi:FtsP/CotA-like multicopper oxidase with cupredoxin domain